jgi:hypothetical protein
MSNTSVGHKTKHEDHLLAEEGDLRVCPHCMDYGWVMMIAENDDGAFEDYFVLCRRCKEGGVR